MLWAITYNKNDLLMNSINSGNGTNLGANEGNIGLGTGLHSLSDILKETDFPNFCCLFGLCFAGCGWLIPALKYIYFLVFTLRQQLNGLHFGYY